MEKGPRFPAPLVTVLNELWGTLLGSYIYKQAVTRGLRPKLEVIEVKPP